MMAEVFLIARLVLGGVWIYAGISKLWRRTSLTATLEGFGIQNALVIRVVNRTAPWLEVLLGLGLLSGVFSLGFGLISLLSLLIFTMLFIRVVRSGASLSCNCFGGHEEAISVFDMVRNLYFALLSVMAMLSRNTFSVIDLATVLGSLPLFLLPFLLFFQFKLLASIGKNIKKSNNEVFNDYYGSAALMRLARWFRVEGN